MKAESFVRDTLAKIGVAIGGDGPADIHLHDDRLFAGLIRDRELGLGEAYQQGWWSANHLDEFLTLAQRTNLREHVRPGVALLKLAAASPFTNRQTVRRAGNNASAHYDIGNDLFERMLDKRMIYSCGYWRDAGDLEFGPRGQAKPDLRKVGVGTGCAGARHRLRVGRFCPVRGRALRRARDRSVSGSRNLHGFFDACDAMLAADGIMLHHTIGSNESKDHTDPWFDKHIFKGGVLPSLGQISDAAKRVWSIEDVHNIGPD